MITKNEAPEYKAIVKWYNRPLGFGFANIEGVEEDILIHQSVIDMEGYRYVDDHQEIIIQGIEETEEGMRAVSVRLL